MRFLLLFVAVLLWSSTTPSPALADGMPGTTSPVEGNPAKSFNGISPRDVEADLLVKQHCTKCHSESRIMNALQSMQTSQSGNYDKEVKSIISRKIRLTNGDISRQDGKKIIDYLVSASQRQKAGEKSAS